jgi:hypothetical protein
MKMETQKQLEAVERHIRSGRRWDLLVVIAFVTGAVIGVGALDSAAATATQAATAHRAHASAMAIKGPDAPRGPRGPFGPLRPPTRLV